MKRSLVLPVALVALVAVPLLAACDEATPDALEVNGTTFSQSTIDGELEAITDNEAFVEFVVDQGGPDLSADGRIDSQVSANWLTQVVVGQVATDTLAENDIEITDEDREAGLAQSEELFGGPTIFSEFDESFRNDVVDRNAAIVALDQAVTDGDVELSEDLVDDAVEQAKADCESGRFASHILVPTEAEAAAVVQELDDGADFGELAQERSQDGSAARGGFLGCYEPGTFVAEFGDAVEAATLDEHSDPVATEFGFHVILVSDEPPRDQVTGDPAGLLLRTADVSVDPRYGSWDGELGQVVPPEPAVPPVSTQP